MVRERLRASKPRRVVIDVFFTAAGHTTIEGLLDRARLIDPSVCYSTICRTVNILVASGVAEAHRFGDGRTRYELAGVETHHDHLVCTACGSIAEFCEPEIEAIQREVAERFGFVVRTHKHQLYGLCSLCQNLRSAH